MENENEKQLTEADLSAVKNSIAALCKKYIAGSFFDKLVDSSGIKIAKDILLSDLKEQIGHGTAAAAAKKFANAISMAKSTPAVDTILANYMLKGDGMGAGIGYTESVESDIKSFQQFLSEARKSEKIESTVAESEEEPKYTPEQINEAIEVAKSHGYRVITPEQIDEAKKIVESKGFKVVEKRVVNESEEEKKVEAVLIIPTYDYADDEVADLIKFSLQEKEAPTYLRDKFGEVKIEDGKVKVDLFAIDDPAADLKKIVDVYVDSNGGLESEYDEDLLDYYSVLFKKAKIDVPKD
jgi:hypothetical protein